MVDLQQDNLNIPSIAVVTGLGYAFIHNGIVKTITKILYKNSNKYHKTIIFENVDDKNLFINLSLMPASKGIAVKGCGVNTKYYAPIEKKANDKIIFSFIGRLLYDKGVMEL
ncbi:MAG: hypothetical protein R2771_14785 [Saprospiraceae bacterium]